MKLKFSKKFEMKDLQEAKVFLGLDTESHSAERKLWLTQYKYGSSVLLKFGMDSCHPVNTLMEDCKIFESKALSSAVLSSNRTIYSCAYDGAIGTVSHDCDTT